MTDVNMETNENLQKKEKDKLEQCTKIVNAINETKLST